MDIKELLTLSEDRELITPEIHNSNDYYGHATILKNYAKIPINYPIKASIEHGPGLDNHSWQFDIKEKLPTIIAFSKRRFQTLKKETNKAIFSIGPIIQYAQNILSEEEFKKIKDKLGRNLLVMPAHSTHWINATYNVDKFCFIIDNIGKDFDTINICLGWNDVLLGYAEKYIENGFNCVTAGHMYDSLFLSRLKKYILLSDLVLTNDMGSHIGYSIMFDKPVYMYETELKYIFKSEKSLAYNKKREKDIIGIRNKITSLFSKRNDQVTIEQKIFVNEYFGANIYRTPNEIKNIIDISEDIFLKGKNFFISNKPPNVMYIQAKDYLNLNKNDKALFLIDKIIDVFPDSKSIYYGKVLALFRKNNIDKAKVLIKNMIDNVKYHNKANLLFDLLSNYNKKNNYEDFNYFILLNDLIDENYHISGSENFINEINDSKEKCNFIKSMCSSKIDICLSADKKIVNSSYIVIDLLKSYKEKFLTDRYLCYWSGLILIKKGLFVQAKEEFLNSLEYGFNELRILWNLIKIEYQYGNYSETIKHLKRIQKLNPNFNEAKDMLSKIVNNIQEKSDSINNDYIRIRKFIDEKKYIEALNILNSIKAKRMFIKGIDYLRALCFLSLNQLVSAKQALYEELRYFPNNDEAVDVLNNIPQTKADIVLLNSINNKDFINIYQKIIPYTMLSIQRLYSLYSLTKKICERNIAGDFVECGVAAGGSTALMAFVIKKYSKIKRVIYAFDSFEGMPEPSQYDKHGKLNAKDTGWGTGTCSAPLESVITICKKLGVSEIVKPIKGYFDQTLQKYKEIIKLISFLHMDGDWYESTKDILNNLYDNLSLEAIIQVDDYGFWEGCKKAIHEFEEKRNIKFIINKIDNTGVWFNKVFEEKEIVNYINNNERKLLNLGCGRKFNKKWVNIDINSNIPNVISMDLNNGLTFGDNLFDAVYHSHLLEHFYKNYALVFIKECYRILKPNGILRVVVPDLEQIINCYQKLLKLSLEEDIEAQKRYEWIMLELFDQTVREQSGGEMLNFLEKNPIPARDFVINRFGSEALNIINNIKKNNSLKTNNNKIERSYEDIGKFRKSGEVHQWMYDRYSLKILLEKAGFNSIRVCKANESKIPDFNSYLLDIESDGSIRKPDSLFMEATKEV